MSKYRVYLTDGTIEEYDNYSHVTIKNGWFTVHYKFLGKYAKAGYRNKDVEYGEEIELTESEPTRIYKGCTVGDVEKQAEELVEYLENYILSMVLAGEVIEEHNEYCGVQERALNWCFGTMVSEIDRAMSARERNRKVLNL